MNFFEVQNLGNFSSKLQSDPNVQIHIYIICGQDALIFNFSMYMIFPHRTVFLPQIFVTKIMIFAFNLFLFGNESRCMHIFGKILKETSFSGIEHPWLVGCWLVGWLVVWELEQVKLIMRAELPNILILNCKL